MFASTAMPQNCCLFSVLDFGFRASGFGFSEARTSSVP